MVYGNNKEWVDLRALVSQVMAAPPNVQGHMSLNTSASERLRLN